MHLDIDQPLDLRLAEFRSDPEKMKFVNDFIDELVEKAQKEAEIRRNNNCKQKHKLVGNFLRALDEFSLIFAY